MRDDFSVDVSSDGTQVRLTAHGDLDMARAPDLLDLILVCGIVQQHPQVVLDLAAVTFMDSSGLATLVEARNRLHADGAELSVVDVPPLIRQVMEMSGLDTYLHVGHTPVR